MCCAAVLAAPDATMLDAAREESRTLLADGFRDLNAGRVTLCERGKGQFKSYLATMLRNELISRFRRMQAKSRVDGWAGAPRTSPAAPLPAPSVSSSADDMPAWSLARHRAAVEHVLTRTAISEQSRRIYRELLATGDNCAEVARRMNLPAATVRQVKSRVSRMIAAFEKATR